MNVYDFDNTLYRGESTLDFYFYCVKHHPKLVKYIFIILFNLIKYKLLLITPEKFEYLAKKYVSDFIRHCPDARQLTQSFWQSHSCKLKSFYTDVRKPDDVVMSASFGFMLEPAMKTLGISRYVTSQIDLDTATVGELCFGSEKTKLFAKYFGNENVDDFYTDSLNDKPMIQLATGNVYLVKNNKIILYKCTTSKGKTYE